jgi:glycine/D-amino acid oxidase-like deaminating enzyme
MRLRTFESFWLLKNGILGSYPSLRENLTAEIVVVGGGITGALVSHSLVEKGYDVLLLDKRDIGQGSTSATTSMLQYEIDVPLTDLRKMIGEKAAADCYKAGIKAIKNLGKLVDKYDIDCGFEMKQSLFIAHEEKAVDDLHKEFLLRHKHKLGVKWLNAEQLSKQYGLVSHGGILSSVAGSIDAYKLTHELIQLNVRRGLRVYDQTEIEDFSLNSEKSLIQIKGNWSVSCEKVIFCTGYESTSMLKEKVAKLFYTYACVSERGINIPQKLNDTLIWDTNQPYLYMRVTDDGRMLVGGEDSSINFSLFQQKIKERKAVHLIKKLKKLLPHIDFVEDFNWGGTFGSTKDGLPYIGKSPEYQNALFVLGFGGNGITFSIQAMEIIPDLLKGKKNSLAKNYRFGR